MTKQLGYSTENNKWRKGYFTTYPILLQIFFFSVWNNLKTVIILLQTNANVKKSEEHSIDFDIFWSAELWVLLHFVKIYNNTIHVIFQVYGWLKSMNVFISPKSTIKQLPKSSKKHWNCTFASVNPLFVYQKWWFVKYILWYGRKNRFSLSILRKKSVYICKPHSKA